MKNESIWIDKKLQKEITTNEDITTDILIIGGGITGLTTAYFLKDKDKKITIIDRDNIGNGTTSKSTGKLTYLQNDVYENIKKKYGAFFASNYLKSQMDAIEIVKNIIIDNRIDCNFDSNSSYLFTNEEKGVKKIKRVENILKKSNINYKISDNIKIKFPCLYALRVDGTATFNPFKYLISIKDILINNGIQIYEKIKAINFIKTNSGFIVKTDKQKIFTKKIVIACHYPFFNLPNFYLKTYLEKSYLVAAKIDKNKKMNAISVDKDVDSIRYYSNKYEYIIYLSEAKSLGKNMDNKKNYEKVIWRVKSTLSQEITNYWFNYDLMTLDSIPLIGYLEKDNYDLLIGTGYNTWGLTNGTIAGKVISDLLLDKVNEYSDLFNPTREMMISNANKLVVNNISQAKIFIESKINKKQHTNKAYVVSENNISYGIYIDDNGNKYKVFNKCPHLSCSLSFNEIDKTWDCPCHGSRFDIRGVSVKGPSIYSIKLPKKEI